LNTHKLYARLAGVLILLATVTFATGSGLLDSVLTQPDVLEAASANQSRIFIGVLLEYVNAFSAAGVAILLFPLLRPHNSAIAVSYIVTRVLEAALLIVSGIAALALIPLSESFIAAGMPDDTAFQPLTTLLLTQYNLGYQAAMFALGVGSIPFCAYLFTARLIPRWLAFAGVVGYIALAASTLVAVIGYENISLYLYAPGALFEIVFPLWLIVRGLGTPQSDQPTASGTLHPAEV